MFHRHTHNRVTGSPHASECSVPEVPLFGHPLQRLV